jgi:alginate O-acetyltransferase complex protein AlgI
VTATFLAVCVGWVFFRAQSFGDAATILAHMAVPTFGKAIPTANVSMALALLAIVFICHLVGTFIDIKRWERRIPAPILGTGMATVLLLAQVLMPEDGQAFIYFQF